MTTHRLTVLFRVSAVAVLAAGAIAGVATPAYAVGEPTVTIPANDLEWRVGDPPADLTATIKNTLPTDVPLVIQLFLPDGLGSDVAISARPAGCAANPCTVAFDGNESKTMTWKLTTAQGHTLGQNQVKNGNGRIRASSASGPGEAPYSVKLTGPSQAAPVPEVSGRVTDSVTGLAVKDATVVVEDGANRAHNAGTDSQGRFRVLSTAQNPITPGQIKIGAAKDGYETVPDMVDGRSNVAIRDRSIKLKPLAGPSATPGPEITDPNMTTDPSMPVEEGEEGNAAGSGNDAGGPGLISWVLIALGGVLVLLGIGAIILLLRRRGEDDEDGDDDEPAPVRPNRRGPAPAAAGARGGYRNPGSDATAVVNRAPMGGPGGPGAPTMVAGPGGPGGRGNLHDATAIVRPTPVAAPPRGGYPGGPPPGAPQSYAGPHNGYGPQKPAYGGPGGPGGPVGPGGYPPEPGYGQPSGGGYGPSSRPAADGYSASDYAGGYAQPGPSGGGGYGGGYEDEATHRYDAGGGGYGQPGPSSGGGGYGSGYESGAGYEREGYDRGPDPRGGGGGYESGGGSYGPSQYDGPGGRSPGYDNGYQQPPPRRPNERLDWMDD